MEQRWSTRTPVKLDVDMAYEDKEEDCSTRDIGMGGVFLEMGSILPPVDTMVELIFKPTNAPSTRSRPRWCAWRMTVSV